MEFEGTIGLLTTEQGRFARFWSSFLSIRAPGPVHVITKYSLNIAEARNQILCEAKGGWVWFMDDDHTFPPDLLLKLLERNVDVIQPLVLTRYTPFGPVMMGARVKEDPRKHWRYALMPGDPVGIKEVNAVGCAGMLVRRYVWEAMMPPYFRMGAIAEDVLAEDIDFCVRARELGFKVYADMENPMGHMNVGEVWPIRKEDGSWATLLKFGEHRIEIPAALPKAKIGADGQVREVE